MPKKQEWPDLAYAWRALRYPLQARSTFIAEWLAVIAGILLVLVGLKSFHVTRTTFANNKDFLDALTKIATLVTIAVGAVLSYIRFFKGRLLSPKLLILPSSGVIQGHPSNLHWIEIEIKNAGTVSIWNYAVEVKVKLHGEDESIKRVTNFLEWETGMQGETSIDIGESAYEHAFLEVPAESVDAVTFQVAVYANRGTRWTRCLTVPNPPNATSQSSFPTNDEVL